MPCIQAQAAQSGKGSSVSWAESSQSAAGFLASATLTFSDGAATNYQSGIVWLVGVFSESAWRQRVVKSARYVLSASAAR